LLFIVIVLVVLIVGRSVLRHSGSGGARTVLDDSIV